MNILASNGNTVTVSNNDVVLVLPASAHDLNQRRIDLEQATEIEPDVYAALWYALADDFDAIGYTMSAECCRRRAEHYQGAGSSPQDLPSN